MTDRLRELLDPTPSAEELREARMHDWICEDKKAAIRNEANRLSGNRTALVRETCELLMRKFDDAAEIKGDMDDPMIQARNMVGLWMMEATKPIAEKGPGNG